MTSQQEQCQVSIALNMGSRDSASELEMGAPLPSAKPGAEDKKPIFSDLKPLFKSAPDETVAVLAQEFGLDRVPGSHEGADEDAGASEARFPAERLCIRGDSLVLASSDMAKIWCSAKGLQVMEAGHYIASGVRQAPRGPLEAWRVYPEAASILGCWAQRRIARITSAAVLERLLVEARQGIAVPYEQLLDGARVPENQQMPPQGLLLLAIVHTESTLQSMYATMGHILGKIDAEGLVTLPEDSWMAARRWVEVLSRRGHCELEHTLGSAIIDEDSL
mmetsp:Transcript_89192/g.231332  ORF Transcript_89192/g.231332 Transcript_89192/m.231332 type:complete len:277 (+) Transcript_89192:64-894(+)